MYKNYIVTILILLITTQHITAGPIYSLVFGNIAARALAVDYNLEEEEKNKEVFEEYIIFITPSDNDIEDIVIEQISNNIVEKKNSEIDNSDYEDDNSESSLEETQTLDDKKNYTERFLIIKTSEDSSFLEKNLKK